MKAAMKRQQQVCGTGFHVRLWCNTDPCGLICAAISWLLVLYAECVVVVRWATVGLETVKCAEDSHDWWRSRRAW